MPTSTTIANSGNAQCIFQIGVTVNGQQSVVDVRGTADHCTTTIKERINAWSESVTILASSDEEVIRVVQPAMSSGEPECKIRFGIGTPRAMQWLPWQRHFITEFSAIPYGNGTHHVKICTADPLWKISRAHKIVSRQGLISDMVKAIAAEHQIEAIVEPTIGKFSLVQPRISDFTFIVDRCISRAVNEKGRGNFRLYVKDSVLHFHSPDYQSELKELSYFGPTNSLSLIQSDRSQVQCEDGAAGAVVRMVAHNPMTGETQAVRSDSSRVLKIGNSAPEIPQEYDRIFSYHVGENGAVEGENIIQNKYEQQRSAMYSLELKTTKTPLLRINDFIDIKLGKSGADTSWAGYYSVSQSTHVIDKGDLVSAFTLHRGELQTNRASQQAMRDAGNTNIVSSANEAQGQQISLLAVGSSTIGPTSREVRDPSRG